MIKALLNGIMNIISMLVGFILTPINLLMSTLFPDMTNSINNFTYTVNNFIAPYVSYFFNLLPSRFASFLLLWLTFIVSYYSVYYTYLGIVKIFNIIQKIKFW